MVRGSVVRIFKTKWLARFARQQRIGDRSLVEAIARTGRGLVDADLGGGLIKQCVARPGQGRSGGFRMLIAYRAGERAVFLFGFAKNERDNIEPDELLSLREIGAAWLEANADQIDQALADETLSETRHDDDEAADPADKGIARDGR